jgi:GH25 family lysozyme M1 (1,4-beta-N-acetylmuramidase)
MEAAGYYCGIYASDFSGFKDRLELSRLTAFDKWVANYISQPGYVESYGMWQRSSQGRVNGITGNVDIDECYQDYPTIIKANGLNGFPKPEQPKPQEPPKKSMKVTVEYDDHIYSGLLEEQL